MEEELNLKHNDLTFWQHIVLKDGMEGRPKKQ